MKRKKAIGRAGYIAPLAFLLSFFLLSYPFFSNYLFEHRADSIIRQVEAADLPEKEKEEAFAEARNYNETLCRSGVRLHDPFLEELLGEVGDYRDILSTGENGEMGYIEIPSIDVRLPIYHGTSEEVLEKGVGHLEGTSFPIGGDGTHAVLTGHTGLSGAKLFTDLTELKEGDIFEIVIMKESLTYRIDKISTHLPTQLDELYVQEGRDLCTLVTCTPYGVNSHRLFVRGTRCQSAVDIPEEAVHRKETGSKWMQEYRHALMASGLLFLACLFLLSLAGKIKRKRWETGIQEGPCRQKDDGRRQSGTCSGQGKASRKDACRTDGRHRPGHG